MAIKIDMEKAFDRMEWSFILAILSSLDSIQLGLIGFGFALLLHLSLFSLTAILMVSSTQNRVYDMGIPYLLSFYSGL
jgi:hypothetical protein